jgi:F-type H+-transporting ATPase subunit gamma
MATSRAIKNQIKSTKNIKQITKAMEAVSAVKMRKSEVVALKARPYALSALEIFKGLSARLDNNISNLSPLLEQNKSKKIGLVVITSDKGLAGSFNTNVLRKALEILKDKKDEFELITVGKKGKDFLGRRGFSIAKDFLGAGDFVELEETRPISIFIKEGFLNKRWSKVILLYTNFMSALKQETITREMLPFSFESISKIVDGITPDRGRYANMPSFIGQKEKGLTYKFEPDPVTVLNELLPALLEIEVHHAILEANASEHSSRMVAMKNASENAGELIGELTLVYNKARQAQITKELTEITAGKEALEN